MLGRFTAERSSSDLMRSADLIPRWPRSRGVFVAYTCPQGNPQDPSGGRGPSVTGRAAPAGRARRRRHQYGQVQTGMAPILVTGQPTSLKVSAVPEGPRAADLAR